MTDLDKAKKLLKTLRQDAKLALSGSWDKSDEGFEAQIHLIDQFFNDCNKQPKSKFKQKKLFE